MLHGVTENELLGKPESPQGDLMALKGSEILSPKQCRAARAGLKMTAQELADKANVHRVTVARFENDGELIAATAMVIRRALEDAGCEFVGTDTVRFK